MPNPFTAPKKMPQTLESPFKDNRPGAGRAPFLRSFPTVRPYRPIGLSLATKAGRIEKPKKSNLERADYTLTALVAEAQASGVHDFEHPSEATFHPHEGEGTPPRVLWSPGMTHQLPRSTSKNLASLCVRAKLPAVSGSASCSAATCCLPCANPTATTYTLLGIHMAYSAGLRLRK